MVLAHPLSPLACSTAASSDTVLQRSLQAVRNSVDSVRGASAGGQGMGTEGISAFARIVVVAAASRAPTFLAPLAADFGEAVSALRAETHFHLLNPTSAGQYLTVAGAGTRKVVSRESMASDRRVSAGR